METKTKHYFHELPENYVMDHTIDPKDKKTLWTMRIMFFVLFIVTFVICEAFNRFNFVMQFELIRTILAPIVFIAAYIVMIILHELIHGLFNVIFTHEKLVFGFNKSSAYCGTPNIYIKKGPKMVVAMAPFFTFLIVLIIPLVFIKDPFYYLLISILLGIHVSGCSGDLIEFFTLLFKYHGKKALIYDTGPTQTIYVEQQKN